MAIPLPGAGVRRAWAGGVRRDQPGTKIQTVMPRAATSSEFRRRAGLELLVWPAFDALGLDAFVPARPGGVSSGEQGEYSSLNLSFQVGDEPGNVLENRRRVAAAIGAGLDDFVFANQVHGRVATIVTEADRGRGARDPGDAIPGADALVTSDPGTVLAVLAADCVPIVLYDPVSHVLACVHAGWRGAVARVTDAALAAMGSLGTRPGDVIAGLGPAIAQDSYQVGDEVADEARRSFGEQARSMIRPDGTGRWLFDIWTANRQALREAGVPAGQIHVAGVSTGPDPGHFFSHRAQRPCGRAAAVARLHPRGTR